jgi:hypothetical protein
LGLGKDKVLGRTLDLVRQGDPHGRLHARGEMTEVGFAKKPVAFTAAITALVLFGISRFV